MATLTTLQKMTAAANAKLAKSLPNTAPVKTTPVKTAPVKTVVPNDPPMTATNVKAGVVSSATPLVVPGYLPLDIIAGDVKDALKAVTVRPTTNPWYPVIEALAARKGAAYVKIMRDTAFVAPTPQETVKERQGTCYHESEDGELVAREDHCMVKSAKSGTVSATPMTQINAGLARAMKLGLPNFHKLSVRAANEKGVWYLIRRP